MIDKISKITVTARDFYIFKVYFGKNVWQRNYFFEKWHIEKVVRIENSINQVSRLSQNIQF